MPIMIARDQSIEKSVYAWSMREAEPKRLDQIRYKLYRIQYRAQCFFSFCMILSVQASRIAEPRKVIWMKIFHLTCS